MKIIGLCGQSGAGKTTALESFERAGFGVIDCDELAKLVTSPGSACLAALAQAFGDGIIDGDGALKRQALADIAFSAPEKLEALNRITHGYILDEVFIRVEKYSRDGFPAVVIDAPVLFESGLDKRCDTTLAICADRQLRIGRIIERDKISRERAEARIDRQMSESELEVLAQKVIYNNGTPESFCEKICEYIKEIGEGLGKT